MMNASEDFNTQFKPVKALLIYQSDRKNDNNQYAGSDNENRQVYVESFDIDKQCNPINAHPLSMAEMVSLSLLFQSTQELRSNYLKSKGVLPNKVLYLNAQTNGFAVWYTPPQEVSLYFVPGLKIKNGKAKIPGMVWKATKESLNVYAIKGKVKPGDKTPLFHAPFFNLYDTGNVCMGTVNIQIDRLTSLEDFMTKWENYFFNSYFSHTIGNHHRSEDLVALWQSLVDSGRDFPQEQLIKHHFSFKTLLQ
ncbi:MAG: PRTRC system protein B [Bacteroidetes bacterium]|nr:PRTRC system protein B [Bacteroidota bacterium]